MLLQIKKIYTCEGCIYQYDAEHPMGSGKGFTELDEPNFAGSFYSATKAQVEKVLVKIGHVLTSQVATKLR